MKLFHAMSITLFGSPPCDAASCMMHHIFCLLSLFLNDGISTQNDHYLLRFNLLATLPQSFMTLN